MDVDEVYQLLNMKNTTEVQGRIKRISEVEIHSNSQENTQVFSNEWNLN